MPRVKKRSSTDSFVVLSCTKRLRRAATLLRDRRTVALGLGEMGLRSHFESLNVLGVLHIRLEDFALTSLSSASPFSSHGNAVISNESRLKEAWRGSSQDWHGSHESCAVWNRETSVKLSRQESNCCCEERS